MVGVDLSPRSDTDLPLQADVTDSDQVADVYTRARERFGRIDVLFNNAGISPADDVSVLDTSLEAWQRVQDVNLKSSSSAASTASRICSTAAAGRSSTPRRSWR